jgi:hypothetical protein
MPILCIAVEEGPGTPVWKPDAEIGVAGSWGTVYDIRCSGMTRLRAVYQGCVKSVRPGASPLCFCLRSGLRRSLGMVDGDRSSSMTASRCSSCRSVWRVVLGYILGSNGRFHHIPYLLHFPFLVYASDQLSNLLSVSVCRSIDPPDGPTDTCILPRRLQGFHISGINPW